MHGGAYAASWSIHGKQEVMELQTHWPFLPTSSQLGWQAGRQAEQPFAKLYNHLVDYITHGPTGRGGVEERMVPFPDAVRY